MDFPAPNTITYILEMEEAEGGESEKVVGKWKSFKELGGQGHTLVGSERWRKWWQANIWSVPEKPGEARNGFFPRPCSVNVGRCIRFEKTDLEDPLLYGTV